MYPRNEIVALNANVEVVFPPTSVQKGLLDRLLGSFGMT